MEQLGFETVEQPSLEQLKNSTMLWKNRSAKTLLLSLLLWGQPSSHKVTSYPRVSSPSFSLLNFNGFHFMLVWAETFQNYQRRVIPAYIFCLQSVSNIYTKYTPKWSIYAVKHYWLWTQFSNQWCYPTCNKWKYMKLGKNNG